jgi:hypothetical protein
MRAAWVLGALVALAGPVEASGLYKCVVNGKTVYQGVACPGGQALKAPPPPSAEDAMAARIRGEQLVAEMKRKDREEELARRRARFNASMDAVNEITAQYQAQRSKDLADRKKSACDDYRAAIDNARVAAVRNNSTALSKSNPGHMSNYNTLCR